MSLNNRGESVGEYPSLAQWRPIVVNADAHGLELTAGFSQWAFLEPAFAVLTHKQMD